MKTFKRKRAFTSIELIAVLAIMGIILLIAMPKMSIYIETSEQTQVKYNHQTLIYCMREWSLNNKNKNIIPASFTVKNSQGKTLVDYLQYYNNELYKDIFEGKITAPVVKEITNGKVRYSVSGGILKSEYLVKNKVTSVTTAYTWTYNPVSAKSDLTGLTIDKN
ncbi:MAG: type II secretion system protein [Peptostreptococcaceae bacterium]|nr:type II secretion system protein [Peptostreptococcaceae bacterium]